MKITGSITDILLTRSFVPLPWSPMYGRNIIGRTANNKHTYLEFGWQIVSLCLGCNNLFHSCLMRNKIILVILQLCDFRKSILRISAESYKRGFEDAGFSWWRWRSNMRVAWTSGEAMDMLYTLYLSFDEICRLETLYCTSRVPVEGKSSVCLICMKYRIIFLIIIIISLGQIILSYIWQTHHVRTHTHTCTHAHTRRPTRPAPSPSRLSLLHGRCASIHDEDTPSFRLFRWPWMAGRCFIEINSRNWNKQSR